METGKSPVSNCQSQKCSSPSIKNKKKNSLNVIGYILRSCIVMTFHFCFKKCNCSLSPGSIERSPETSGRPTPSPVPNSVDTGALSVDQIDSILKVIEDSCKKVTRTWIHYIHFLNTLAISLACFSVKRVFSLSYSFYL